MAGVKNVEIPKEFEIAIRCFGNRQLSGIDLATIHDSVLGMTQEQIADLWGFPKRKVALSEKQVRPDIKTCDAYRGLMLRQFLMQGDGNGAARTNT